MKVERTRPSVYQLTLHAYELAALIAAARWVVEEADDQIPAESVDQLRSLLESYDAQLRRLDQT